MIGSYYLSGHVLDAKSQTEEMGKAYSFIASVAYGNWVLPQDCKESIPRTHAQEIAVWQDVSFAWKAALSTHSAMEKAQHCLQQGQNKGQC